MNAEGSRLDQCRVVVVRVE
jgi:uncharacterized protein YbjT (DUF2867 family)